MIRSFSNTISRAKCAEQGKDDSGWLLFVFRICGHCPETLVSWSNSVVIRLQSDAGGGLDELRRFALRIERTSEPPSFKHVRNAEISDPSAPTLPPLYYDNIELDYNEGFNGFITTGDLEIGASASNKLLWLKICLPSIFGVLLLVITIIFFIKRKREKEEYEADIGYKEPKLSKEQKWLKSIPKPFKEQYMSSNPGTGTNQTTVNKWFYQKTVANCMQIINKYTQLSILLFVAFLL